MRNSEICRAIRNYLFLANFTLFSQYSLISICPAQGSDVVISSAVCHCAVWGSPTAMVFIFSGPKYFSYIRAILCHDPLRMAGSALGSHIASNFHSFVWGSSLSSESSHDSV